MVAYFRRIPLSRKREQEAPPRPRLLYEPGPKRNGIPRKFNDGYLRGVAAEERFVRICAEAQRAGKFPAWLRAVMRGSNLADAHGIDFLARTSLDFIPIQVKSSWVGKEKFHAQADRRHIICIVINNRLTDEDIFRTTLEEVSHVWEMMCRARAAP